MARVFPVRRRVITDMRMKLIHTDADDAIVDDDDDAVDVGVDDDDDEVVMLMMLYQHHRHHRQQHDLHVVGFEYSTCSIARAR